MSINDFFQSELGVNPQILSLVDKAEHKIKQRFRQIDQLSEYNQGKILKYMKQCKISARHFQPSTGYGYGDEGRDQLEKLFALVFGAEDALVRPQWGSGTHVISDALYGVLRPGDRLISITGKPYDTLEETIGINNQSLNNGSLLDWGISYDQIDLDPMGKINIEEVLKLLDKPNSKAVFIQRSRGYEWRPSIPIGEMKEVISKIKSKHPDVFILVDNCYGEFTCEIEPSHIGADLTVGSLIKNPGGGLAPTGGYAVGTKRAIELLSYRLTSPSVGREVGSYAASYLPFYQGLFMAPHVVGESLKGMTLGANIFQSLGFEVLPNWEEDRSDIIQCINFNTDEELITFCQAIQWASPVDSHVTPIPWAMPGYSHEVIMAAGAFIQGASIELSADAPIKEPYIAYLQGGLTYAHVKFALISTVSKLYEGGYISL
ncbi:MAG TPA: methionine gamma-lyase family protein [Clostridia bacterium]|nr:methionine gamma-lyase family protein [Clostridia bacterium]